MKRVRIFGCSHNKKLKSELRDAALFFIEQLFPRKRILDLSISLTQDLCETYGVYGECWENDSHIFNIKLDKDLSKIDLIKTLGHEMAHVKQFARGELKFGSGRDRWFGKVYPLNTPYSKQPWEREANRLEKKLYIKYIEYILDVTHGQNTSR